MRVVVVDDDGRRSEIPLRDLVDLIAAGVKASLLEEGFVSQADIKAKELRLREYARRCHGADLFRVIQ